MPLFAVSVTVLLLLKQIGAPSADDSVIPPRISSTPVTPFFTVMLPSLQLPLTSYVPLFSIVRSVFEILHPLLSDAVIFPSVNTNFFADALAAHPCSAVLPAITAAVVMTDSNFETDFFIIIQLLFRSFRFPFMIMIILVFLKNS